MLARSGGRGAAALRGVAVGLRPAVPGADGEAGRGQYRGALPSHLRRAEDHVQEPPLDRGHRYLKFIRYLFRGLT